MTAGAALWGCDRDTLLADVLRHAASAVGQLRGTCQPKATGQRRSTPGQRPSGTRPGPGAWQRGGGGLAGARRGTWWPGPPQPPGSKASRGDVRAAILALLREGPRNGYQIMSDIEERSKGAWRPSPGAVYPALAQLADEGLIADERSGGRRMFSLTDEGRTYVKENPDLARGAWESAERQESWQVPGLFAEAARLGSGIVQLAQAGSASHIAEAERLLRRTRRELYRILADDFADAEDLASDEDFDEAGDFAGANDGEPGTQPRPRGTRS